MKNIFDHIAPHKIFLIDGIGAVVTAVLHGFVLISLEKYIGMPKHVLFYLASAAVIFAIYSFSCSFFAGENWRPLLRIIASANLLFCLISLGLLFYFFPQIKVLGWIYFIMEIVIVSFLAIAELRKASKS